uniref:Tyrosine aminotransferase n=1 Tax=Panagrolaimus sp. JU765 TaxID=591449 RepID=A0AC34Q5V7_9BILA
MVVAASHINYLPRKYSPPSDRMTKSHRRALAVLKPNNNHRVPIEVTKPIARRPSESWTKMRASKHARNTVNPIRRIADKMSVPPNPDKYPIKLNLGDPTLMGNLPPSEASVAAIIETVLSHKSDGYGVSVGTLAARQAVADAFSLPGAPIDPDNVILASGCSHAIQMALEALADPGDNILVPYPGFPLYTTLCTPHGIETRGYGLRMNEDGLIDLVDLERKIDSRTRAIIINNPSNPTGIVFPKHHLEAILKIAEKHRVVIVADEIYGNLTYDEEHEFIPIASLSPKVPIITCDGIGKRFLVPGWRLGWAIVHNRYGVLSEVREGMIALSQKIVGPCSLIQGALPKILRDTPKSYFDNITSVLRENADICMNAFSQIPCMKALRPQGAMYLMVKIDEEQLGEETELVQELIRNESVYCLPGSAFNCPGWIRLVLTLPQDITREACERISRYCITKLAKGKQ